jgi:hypothetical protein
MIFDHPFNALLQKYFTESPINDIKTIFGIRNVNNLQRQLVHPRSHITKI